jgi:hypothetical protein
MNLLPRLDPNRISLAPLSRTLITPAPPTDGFAIVTRDAPFSKLFKLGRKGDLHVTVLYAHGTAGDCEVRIAVPLARAHIELPSVPRAGDDLAGELAFADWSSRVRTGIVDGKERSVHVEQCNPNSVDLDRFSGSRGNVFCSRDCDKIRHAAS